MNLCFVHVEFRGHLIRGHFHPRKVKKLFKILLEWMAEAEAKAESPIDYQI